MICKINPGISCRNLQCHKLSGLLWSFRALCSRRIVQLFFCSHKMSKSLKLAFSKGHLEPKNTQNHCFNFSKIISQVKEPLMKWRSDPSPMSLCIWLVPFWAYYNLRLIVTLSCTWVGSQHELGGDPAPGNTTSVSQPAVSRRRNRERGREIVLALPVGKIPSPLLLASWTCQPNTGRVPAGLPGEWIAQCMSLVGI